MLHHKFTLRNGDTFTVPIPQTYSDCLALIKSDRYRLTGRMESTFATILKSLLPFRSHTLFWFRLAAHRRGWLYPLFKVLHKAVSRREKIDMPPTVPAGYGLYLGHSMCMVVSPHTVIGNNVNLSQFVNIGTNTGNGALIADQTYIGPQACIVGNVELGPSSTIGAGAVVTHDIPSGATAAGVPARVLSPADPADPARYIANPYPC